MVYGGWGFDIEDSLSRRGCCCLEDAGKEDGGESVSEMIHAGGVNKLCLSIIIQIKMYVSDAASAFPRSQSHYLQEEQGGITCALLGAHLSQCI
jgi:hypothetical protein